MTDLRLIGYVRSTTETEPMKGMNLTKLVISVENFLMSSQRKGRDGKQYVDLCVRTPNLIGIASGEKECTAIFDNKEVLDIHQNDIYWLTKAMKEHGGSFIQHLAELLTVADTDNTRRIISAFSDDIEQYRILANEMRSQEE